MVSIVYINLNFFFCFQTSFLSSTKNCAFLELQWLLVIIIVDRNTQS